ncbi:Polynucleotide adenylyltransferase region [Magnetococcus marinus MC-1]|uniref:Polynucleotide adenylyltransferase region n=1 Tax=Magnetococcus marinus (strain ATCC BAA-1437 / JCM 17883 / MC-1) TaxID=156889 RepID=A0L904_MAGMM|nr:polynucleotide adenylyltransferase [Magnetococcus marinus]ABK44447.1 Polynucleotide adenylyltransferase region [Magnetococcus marinus MC-1]
MAQTRYDHLGLERLPGVMLYEVGGSVRDRLLGQRPRDQDWVVVGACPEQLQQLGYKKVGADFPVFLHPYTQEEYALARRERKQGCGYLGFAVEAPPTVTLEQDLARRDLTINAMARTLDGQLIDPYGGVQDLQNRTLRHVTAAFAEDPLRVLRVARLLARLAPMGFAVDPATERLCRQLVAQGELGHVCPERVWRESQKGLLEPRGDRFAQFVQQIGVEFIPSQRLHPAACAFSRLSMACAQPGDVTVRLVAWLWDLLAQAGEEAQGDVWLHALAKRLALPKGLQREAAWLLSHLSVGMASVTADVEGLYALLEGLHGGLRQPRTAQFLQLCQIEQTLFHGADRLLGIKKAMKIWQSVKPQAIMADGYKGAELGQRLKFERLQQLRQQWPHLW